jgi:hypothetical protein
VDRALGPKEPVPGLVLKQARVKPIAVDADVVAAGAADSVADVMKVRLNRRVALRAALQAAGRFRSFNPILPCRAVPPAAAVIPAVLAEVAAAMAAVATLRVAAAVEWAAAITRLLQQYKRLSS